MPDSSPTQGRCRPLMERLGAMLRQQRLDLGRSQAHVAAALGRTQTWLSYIESGRSEPRLNDLDALLRELDLSLRIEKIDRG